MLQQGCILLMIKWMNMDMKKGGSWIETQRGGSQTWEDHKQNHGWGGTLLLYVTKIVHLKY